MRDRGSDSRSPRHDRLQKGKSASRLRDTRIVPGHVATFPSPILGYLFRRTAQNAKGARPLNYGAFPCYKVWLRTGTHVNDYKLPNRETAFPRPTSHGQMLAKNIPQTRRPPVLGRHEHNNPTKEQDKHLGLEKGRGQTHGETPCEQIL